MLITYSSLHTFSDVMGAMASIRSIPKLLNSRKKKTYALGFADYGVKDARIVHLVLTFDSVNKMPACMEIILTLVRKANKIHIA